MKENIHKCRLQIDFVSLSSVKKLVYQYREKGNVAYGYDRVGRKPKITSEYKEKMIQLLQEKPDMTLGQIRDALDIQCHITTIYYCLKDMKYTYKKR